MWKHAPASCDSEVSRETKDDLDYIVVKKSFIYKGDNSAQTLGASSIYLDDAATVTVEGKISRFQVRLIFKGLTHSFGVTKFFKALNSNFKKSV